MKVFGVGLSKTGTTTLGRCLEILGHSHFNDGQIRKKLMEDIRLRNDLSNAYKIAESFDTFEDWPWPLIYKDLDKRFPGSKFILTLRKDSRTWIESLKKHSMGTKIPGHCRKLAYGYYYPNGHERELIRMYQKHNKEAIDYFSNRKKDFLVVSWEKGDGWEKLCNFLGKDISRQPLPHANKAEGAKKTLPRRLANSVFSILLRYTKSDRYRILMESSFKRIFNKDSL